MISRDLGLSPGAILWLGTWIYLAVLIPNPVRWKALITTFLGMIVGIGAWIAVFGPMMLP